MLQEQASHMLDQHGATRTQRQTANRMRQIAGSGFAKTLWEKNDKLFGMHKISV
jgi:hypothetical protein